MGKKIFILLALMGTITVSQAQTRQTCAEYVDRYKELAIKHMERYGIPASITMAQGILESDSGNSELAKSSNNHFGIKCKTGWTGRSVRHDDDAPQECFRAYDRVEDSYRDHAEFLDTGQRYDSLFRHSQTDYKRWARGLKAAGYATAPHYADMLIKIIEDEKLFLLDHEGGAAMYAQRHNYSAEDFAAGVAIASTSRSSRGAAQETTPEPTARTSVVDPDSHRVTINTYEGYTIYRKNGIYYIEPKDGDTIEKISDKFNIMRRNLRRFNDLEKDAPLIAGEIIYIEDKRESWSGDNATHTVTFGESIASISQLYGVKQGSLLKLNKIKKRKAYLLETGRELKLR